MANSTFAAVNSLSDVLTNQLILLSCSSEPLTKYLFVMLFNCNCNGGSGISLGAILSPTQSEGEINEQKTVYIIMLNYLWLRM